MGQKVSPIVVLALGQAFREIPYSGSTENESQSGCERIFCAIDSLGVAKPEANWP